MTYSEFEDFKIHVSEYNRMIDALKRVRVTPRFELVLDVGGGGAMHSGLLTQIARRVYCVDIIDQNARYNGEFMKLLREKFLRYDYSFIVGQLEFHAGDAMKLIYRDNLFDGVASFNTFEHIPEPARAAEEIVRVMKPGAVAYITFDPIWTADTGGHFYHVVQKPWEHLVVPTDRYIEEMRESGAGEEEIFDFRLSMNRMRLHEFRDIFKRQLKGIKLLSYHEWSGLVDPDHEDSDNFIRALDMGFSREELMTRGIEVVFQKNG